MSVQSDEVRIPSIVLAFEFLPTFDYGSPVTNLNSLLTGYRTYGSVFRATNRRTKQEVAIKILPLSGSDVRSMPVIRRLSRLAHVLDLPSRFELCSHTAVMILSTYPAVG